MVAKMDIMKATKCKKWEDRLSLKPGTAVVLEAYVRLEIILFLYSNYTKLLLKSYS